MSGGIVIGGATHATIALPTIAGCCGLAVRGIAILGDLEDSQILLGANLGADGQPGGGGAGVDSYSTGDLQHLLITGSMISSHVRVGGAIDSITILDEMSADSGFVADELPRLARINGAAVDTRSDPRFVDDAAVNIDWLADARWGGHSPFRRMAPGFADFLVGKARSAR